jgi:ABC-type nickel/cobalt efflux system permease component RcnA
MFGMFGIDEGIAELGGASLVLALVVAVLLGVRHATDPDHLTAVATLIVGDHEHGTRRARRLGFAWGMGHGVTLFVFGLPLILLGDALPEGVQRLAEVAIGALICLLALRLLLRWRAGAFHTHPHSHGGRVHAHPHAHSHAHEPGEGPADGHAHVVAHEHAHEEALGRSPLAAFGIGLVHGVGGSAGAGILLVGAAADGGPAIAALALFAAATAVSMAFLSAGFGLALTSGPLSRRLEGAIPAMGAASLAFGVWYAAGAVDAAPYPF